MNEVTDEIIRKQIEAADYLLKFTIKTAAPKAISLSTAITKWLIKAGTYTPEKGMIQLKRLAKQGDELRQVPLHGEGLKRFDSIARKYGIKYSIEDDLKKQQCTLFFRAKDETVVKAAFKELIANEADRSKRPSFRKTLNRCQEKAEEWNRNQLENEGMDNKRSRNYVKQGR